MDISQVCRFLWITGVVFIIVPHVNMGLLSDYKICGDSECESLLSRVQAIRDHHAKDCRFLSFRRGDTIFVYHKLTGKREDLWAGTIDKQFGYFPKDAVQEEQVYATMEKVVETQRSDFFCMDESGYPIDLDSDDEINNEEIQLQESESTQTVSYADDTYTESLPTATDPSTEAAVSAQRPDGTTAEGDENINADVESHKEAQENPTTLKEQGGSPPSSWLGSSVTGWLGLGKEEESESLTEEDEVKETKAQTLTSSVTGWLGFGGEGKPDDDDVKSKEDNEETASSITSTMTGWLGFGGQTQTQNEQDGEGDMEEENDPKVKFRSRKMSLDLEGSQLHEEEKEEIGTLSWLGSGLTHTLGFGNGNQESEPETSTEREMIEEVKEESGSWLGIGDMFGFRKDKSEVDESRGSDFEQNEENKTTEEETGSEIVDNSQTLPAQTQTEEGETELHIQKLQEKTEKEMIPEVEDSNSSSSSDGDSNKSKQDQVPQSETGTESATVALTEDDSINNSTDALDDSRYNVLPVDAESKVDHTDITPKTKLELERSQSVGEIDEDRSAERDGEEHQTLISTGNDSDSEPGEEEIKTAVEFNPVDLKSDSVGQSVSGTEEDEKDQLQTKKTESEDEGEIMSGETGASDADGGGGGGEGSDEETDALHREISTTQTDEAVDQSQDSERSSPASSSDIDEEGNEPVHSEEEGLTAHIVDSNTKSLSGKVLVEDKDTLSPNEDTTQMENSGGQDQDQDPSVSPQMEQRVKEDENDVDKLKETEKNTENELQQAQMEKETLGLGKEFLTDNTKSEKETEAGDAEKSKGEENQDEREKQNTEKVEEKHQGKPDQAEDTEEKEAQQEVKEAQDGGNQEEVEEVKVVEEIKEEEKQEELAKMKEKEKQVEVEELKEAEKQEVVEELEGGKEEEEEVQVEKKREEVVEVKEEEKQQEADEAKEEENYEEEVALVKKEEGKNEAEEVKEEKKQEEVMEDVKEEEKGNAVEGVQEERKQEEVVEMKAEGAEEGTKQEEVIEVKEEMKPEEVEVKDLQEEEKQKEKKDFPEKGNEEKLENFDKLQKTEMESEEKQTELSHVEPQMENSQNNISREKEIPDLNSKTEQTHTVEEEKIMEETQQVNVVEDDSRDKEEDKCLNELCPQATDDTYVSDVSEDVGMSHTDHDQNDQISPDRTGEVQTPSEGSERIEQEADGLVVDQKNNTDLSHPAESGRHDLPQGNILSQTTEKLSEDKLTRQINDTKPEDTENSSSGTSTEKTLEKMHSSQKTDTEEDTNVRGNKTTDSQMSTDNSVDSESLRDRELESSTIPDGSTESLNGQTAPHVSEQPAGSSPPSDDHNTRTAETENGGAFGLFKNAFSIFGQTPVAETKEPIDSALSLETNTSEPLTPEQELDSGQADESDLSTEQPQPSPSSDEIQMSTSNPHTQSPNTANLLQTKTLYKYYKNLLDHMSVDEMTIMVEFVGQHKLQFLDYMLGSSDTVTEDPDHDESILSDLERLLQHLSETLAAPSMSFTDAPQEDKEKTRTLIALHKLEMLITRVRETFNTAKSDTSKEKHQAEVNCVDASCSTHGNVQETTTEEEKRKDKDRGSEEESMPPASHPQTQPGSTQSLEGVMEQIVDYVHQIAEESTLHMYAVKELLGWITIQVMQTKCFAHADSTSPSTHSHT